MDLPSRDTNIPQTVSSSPSDSPQNQRSTITSVPPKSSRISFKIIVVLIVLFGLLALGIYFIYFSFRQSKDQEISSTTQEPTASPTVSQPTQAPVSHYVGDQTINLQDVKGGNLSGTITRTIAPTFSTHSIQATLTDLPDGSFYQFWIGSQDIVGSMGILSKGAGGKYRLTTRRDFESTASFSFNDLYNYVVISQETTDDSVIETKILEGTFTQ